MALLRFKDGFLHEFTPEEEDEYYASQAVATAPASNPLSARQFRLGLIRGMIPLADAQAAINALSTTERDELQIHWEFSTVFNWADSRTQRLMVVVGIPTEAADAWWRTAMTY